MPRWVLVLVIVAPLALCVGVASLGYVVVRPLIKTVQAELQSAATNEMAESVFRSVSRRIEESDRATHGQTGTGALVLSANDLDVNNATVPGEMGIEVGSGGARIYGVVVEISPAGIALVMPGVTYTGVPVVKDGRVDLTRIRASDDALGFVFSEEMFEESLEGGINRALARYRLRPTSVTLRHGSMIVQTEPATVPAQTWQGGGTIDQLTTAGS